MAKGKKTGGKDFPKGHTFSVGHGRPPTKLTSEEREKLKNMSEDIQRNLVQATHDLLNGKVLTIQEIRNNKEENALKGILSSVLMKAFNKGDMKPIDTILNRVIGPVKQRVDITTKDESINNPDPENQRMFEYQCDVIGCYSKWRLQKQICLSWNPNTHHPIICFFYACLSLPFSHFHFGAKILLKASPSTLRSLFL